MKNIVAFWFTDLAGRWLRHEHAEASVSKSVFSEGYTASSMMTGWKGFGEADLIFKPNVETIFSDPTSERLAASYFAETFESDGKTPYQRDPRHILSKIVESVASENVRFEIGPELEAYIFDEVRFSLSASESFHRVVEPESVSNARETNNPVNKGYVLTHPYHHLSPIADYAQPIRDLIASRMAEAGISPLHCLHESGPSQMEIGVMHADPLRAADQVQRYKHIARATAAEFGKLLTFMPMPFAFNPGSGLHLHISMWKGGRNSFQDPEGISSTCRHAIGGVIKHAKALSAFLAPSSNSYTRLMHLYRSDLDVCFGFGTRSAHVRIPQTLNPENTRIEIRFGDCSANIYLAIGAVILAMMDGIRNSIDPGEPLAGSPRYGGPFDIRARAENSLPRNLEECILALEHDKNFLLQIPGFSEEVIEEYQKILIRRSNSQYLYPHPRDFLESLDC